MAGSGVDKATTNIPAAAADRLAVGHLLAGHGRPEAASRSGPIQHQPLADSVPHLFALDQDAIVLVFLAAAVGGIAGGAPFTAVQGLLVNFIMDGPAGALARGRPNLPR